MSKNGAASKPDEDRDFVWVMFPKFEAYGPPGLNMSSQRTLHF